MASDESDRQARKGKPKLPRRRKEWDEWYRPGPARPVKGGIKAHTRRGAFGETWWGQRWIAALEDLEVGGRLARGKTYARRGQVADLDISPGKIRAKVQGSRARPYRVSIEMPTYRARERSQIAKALASRPSLPAQLASGQMPAEIDELLTGIGLPLFPKEDDDLETECSCPDWSNPCKHIAAVQYLLAEAFDRNPFLLFELRGLKRSDLFGSGDSSPSTDPATQAEPLPADPVLFWGPEGEPAMPPAEPIPPTLTAALPKSLGPFPFWRGRDSLMHGLGPIYESAAAMGWEVLEKTPSSPGDAEKKS